MKKVLYLSSLLALCFSLCSLIATATPTVPHVYFTAAPANDTVCSGTTATFTAAAMDTTGSVITIVSYAWQVSTDGGTTWATAGDTTMYSGDSTATLTVYAGLAMNGYKFRSIGYDVNGSATSVSAQLTVLGIPPGTITGPRTVCRGSSITLLDTVLGGTWTSSTPSTATINSSGVLIGVLPGYDTVKYTDTNMCGGGVAMAVIHVDTIVTAMPVTGPTATCVGHTINLMNANVLGTWAWSASNSRAAITHAGMLTGVAHGLDTVYYVFTNACNAVTSSYLVNVDTVLSAGAISGASVLCSGSWTHLTETVSGGLWFSSNSALATVDASGYLTGVAQGAVTISYYLSNACGASIATHTVNISRTASAITGIDSVGVGLTRTLMDSVSGGFWTSGDTAIATIDSNTGIATGIALGSTTITYTDSNTCGVSTAVVTLYVGNSPDPGTITGSTYVCLGHTTTLSDAVAGGVWSSSDDTLATISTGGVVTGVAVDSGTASTPVTISYEVTNGFGSSTATYMLNVLHTPIISISEQPSTYQVGQNYQIKGTPAGGTWSHTGSGSLAAILRVYDTVSGGVAYGTFVSYIMLTQGRDTLHYKVSNPCGNADSMIVAYIPLVSNVGTVNGQGLSLNVFPNPTQGAFTMSLTSSANEEANVTVTNILGEKVKEFTASTNQVMDVQLDQPAGVYLLTAKTATGTYTARISVAK